MGERGNTEQQPSEPHEPLHPPHTARGVRDTHTHAHDAALTSPHGSAQICAAPKPPHSHPPRPAAISLRGNGSRRLHVVLLDVPREEGRPGSPWLEAPMGALNGGIWKEGGQWGWYGGSALSQAACDSRGHCKYACGATK
ncbi:hypothetical protein IAQ61_012022 [Plenodomus lingam]|uniref:uncharacterized protein n=1 Tax=Leptosphaeria maculans TaxID=5022 RepID=UPI0033198D24|nr:hypothetical protein IAQ61_012022 [Plenodomus lingam]